MSSSRLLRPRFLFSKILERHEAQIRELKGFHPRRSEDNRVCDLYSYDGKNCSALLTTFLFVNYFPRAEYRKMSETHDVLIHDQFGEKYIIDPCYRSLLITRKRSHEASRSPYANYVYETLPPILLCSLRNLNLFIEEVEKIRAQDLNYASRRNLAYPDPRETRK